MDRAVDVLIVGAGPVGLFLANECARRGLSYRLIETRAGQSEHSKALAIMPRTMEIFDMAGIAAPFLEVANRVTRLAVAEPSRTLARMRFEPAESPYPFVAMVPQDVTEKLLVEALREKGGHVEYETTFVTAVQNGTRSGSGGSSSITGAQATIEHKGERSKVSARFVVGCDGAHSAVRHLLNLPFEGKAYEAKFMLADTETNETLPADEMQLCPSSSGPLAIFPMSATRRRIVATVQNPEEDAPSLETVRKILQERGPRGFEARSLKWSSYFRVHHRQVAELRAGSMFVAGDAAHIHSPIGGQGMNTGLHDVWNLAWKLDLVVRGLAGEALLESYSAERRPVIKNVIELTDFMTRALATPSKLAQVVRDTVIPLVSRVAPFQHGMVQRLSQLGITYTGSPIVEGAGKRYFDESLRGGTGIGRRFLLMMAKDAGPATAQAAQQLCGELPEIVELRSAQNHNVTLVRPDGYIAAEAPAREGAHAIASMRSILEKQVKMNEARTSSAEGAAR